MKPNGITNILAAIMAAIFLFSGIDAVASPPRYQRASLTQMMIEHPMYSLNDEIVEAYKALPINPRFNNHDLGVKVVKFATQEYTDQTSYISAFLKKSKVGNRSVAKWFSFNKNTGSFGVNLIKERGLYDANNFDREMANRLVRGSALLEDAGENLIPHTYLIMHDICFNGKYSNRRDDFDRVGKEVSFSVEVTSYIFSLDWNTEKLEEFYAVHYDSQNTNFVKDAEYGYTFRAKVKSELSESSRTLSQRDLIKRVVGRSLDMNIAKLQATYPDFRIMTPLISDSPLKADIGLKEGINENSKFEVLEVEEDKNGILHYTRVGLIKPVAGKIADNRYMSDENDNKYTEFKIISGNDFYEGMLIREVE